MKRSHAKHITMTSGIASYEAVGHQIFTFIFSQSFSPP